MGTFKSLNSRVKEVVADVDAPHDAPLVNERTFAGIARVHGTVDGGALNYQDR